MKKFLFSTLALLALMGTAMAQNSLFVNDFEVPYNSVGTPLTVNFEFDEADKYTGFQAYVELPEVFSYVLRGTDETTPLATKGSSLVDTHMVSANLDEGMAKVAILSSNSDPVVGSSGDLFSLQIYPNADLEVGSTYTGTLKNVVIATTEGVSVKVSETTFTITIGDGRIKFDEGAAILPTYSAGTKGNVAMTRSIKAGSWSTIVLPFTLTQEKAKIAFGDDVKLAEFSNFVVDYGEDESNVTPLGIKINFSTYELGARKSMTGGKPFLIKTSKDVEDFEADDVTLVGVVTDVTKSDDYDTKGKFTGSFVKTFVPADGLFISSNKFWYSTGSTNIKAFRGWFELGAVLDKETDFSAKVAFFIDNETTSIEGVPMSNANLDGAVYNISGQLVGKDVNTKRLQKGVYIRNGKKFVVK